MHAVLAVTAAPVEGLARAIQLSVAPVFLLAGIGGLLVVLTNRLARIVDRSRRLQEQLADAAISQARLARQELQLQKRRMGLVLKAIELCTVTVLLVALVVVPLFTAAMLCLMVAVLLFMREVQLAAAQLRRRF
jgi:hypothetical protein